LCKYRIDFTTLSLDLLPHALFHFISGIIIWLPFHRARHMYSGNVCVIFDFVGCRNPAFEITDRFIELEWYMQSRFFAHDRM